jgi:hypothetical protein
MTAQSPAGWYPDPSGNPGQQYWDGQNWQQVAVPQPALGPDALRAAMAENRSIWVTNGLAAWSLVVGILGLICDLFCGVGIGIAAIGVVVGYLALNKSKTVGQGRGLALAGLITSGAAFVIGFVVLVVIFGGLASL